MRIPKRYGQSQKNICPFCDRQAVTENKQGIPVCSSHKDEYFQDIKCVCGEYLHLRTGKWGPYFHCMNCGNINFKKGMEMAPPKKTPKEETTPSNQKYEVTYEKETINKNPKEITITSDEVDILY